MPLSIENSGCACSFHRATGVTGCGIVSDRGLITPPLRSTQPRPPLCGCLLGRTRENGYWGGVVGRALVFLLIGTYAQLHLAALASLKGEILDLSSRLHSVTQERDLLEKTLTKTQLEKIRLATETEEKLDIQSLRYEERLTELHSVIAELSRKIDRQRALVIREEDDISENEDQDISRDAEGSTTHLADDSELQDVDRTLGDADSSSGENDHKVAESDDLAAAEESHLLNKETATSCHSLQMAALAEELAQQRVENQALQEQLARQEEELKETRGALGGLRGDRDRLRKKIREVESRLQSHAPLSSPPAVINTTGLAVVPKDDMPVCKVAERVMLRKIDRQITGSQLTSLGVCNTLVAESLVSELQEADIQEMRGSDAVRRHYEVEAERLGSRLEHCRAQNTVLALTLEEAKTQADRLSLLVGKYESNATALRLALGYSDRAIEAYDVLVALLESELGLLLANCRAAGIGKQLNIRGESNESEPDSGEMAAILRRASENRRAAETVARHLLSRLDNVSISNAICLSAAPWEEYSHTTSTSSSSDCEWGQSEERRLRDHIGRLKTERSTVRATVVELESCHVEPLAVRHTISLAEARKLDLETAVLMQELMATREDKAELRARVYLLEKERASFELKLSSQEAHHAAQLATIQHLQVQLQETEQLLESRSKAIEIVSSSLQRLRENDEFLLIWGEANKIIVTNNLQPLSLPRQKKPPMRYTSPATAFTSTSVEDYLHHEYFAIIDTAVGGLKSRFDQEGLDHMRKLERSLLKGEINPVLKMYPEINEKDFEIEQNMFFRLSAPTCVEDALTAFRRLSPENRGGGDASLASESEDCEGEGTGDESELSSALRREARLKGRVQELVSTLDKVSRNSELRQQQSGDLVNDLKRANSALVQTLDRSKKKYQTRLRKLEQQMLAMVERHSAQVRALKQRICSLEDETLQQKAQNYQPQLPQGSHSQSSGASETSL
uniref:Harmonin-binding protein USHBP1 PDZ-binding domain-containing protein n=1 Tax=Timema shepardi TaxID=629360 RepID=A0A7R9G140_TIMSH|nr:unnamed protein product [Timema shepardi]